MPCRLAPEICAQPVTGRVLRSVPGRSSGLRCAPLRTSLLVVIWVVWSNRCPPGKLLNAAAALSPSGSWLCTREPLQPLAPIPLSRSRHWLGYPPARPGWLRHQGRFLARAFHSAPGRSSGLRSPDQLLAIAVSDLAALESFDPFYPVILFCSRFPFLRDIKIPK